MSSLADELLHVLGCGAEPRPGADEIERGTAGTGELARRRYELAGLDPRDRSGELCLECWHVGHGEGSGDDRVGPLEEVVDDLDLLRAGAEARERVHQSLQAVVARDDLFRRPL